MADFTVFQDIYADGVAFVMGDPVEPIATQAFPIDLDEVRNYDGGKLAKGVECAIRGITDETFCAGDEITHTTIGQFVKMACEGSARMHDESIAFAKAHKDEMDDWCRNIRVVVNNPACFPSAEEERKRQAKELGEYLGRVLGLGRRF